MGVALIISALVLLAEYLIVVANKPNNK